MGWRSATVSRARARRSVSVASSRSTSARASVRARVGSGRGCVSSFSITRRRLVIGVRSWWEASAVNARSRSTMAPRRWAVVVSAERGGVELRHPRHRRADGEVALAEAHGGVAQAPHRPGQVPRAAAVRRCPPRRRRRRPGPPSPATSGGCDPPPRRHARSPGPHRRPARCGRPGWRRRVRCRRNHRGRRRRRRPGRPDRRWAGRCRSPAGRCCRTAPGAPRVRPPGASTSPGAISSGTWLAAAPPKALQLQHRVGVVAPVDGDGQRDAEEHDRRHRHGEDRQEDAAPHRRPCNQGASRRHSRPGRSWSGASRFVSRPTGAAARTRLRRSG